MREPLTEQSEQRRDGREENEEIQGLAFERTVQDPTPRHLGPHGCVQHVEIQLLQRSDPRPASGMDHAANRCLALRLPSIQERFHLSFIRYVDGGDMNACSQAFQGLDGHDLLVHPAGFIDSVPFRSREDLAASEENQAARPLLHEKASHQEAEISQSARDEIAGILSDGHGKGNVLSRRAREARQPGDPPSVTPQRDLIFSIRARDFASHERGTFPGVARIECDETSP